MNLQDIRNLIGQGDTAGALKALVSRVHPTPSSPNPPPSSPSSPPPAANLGIPPTTTNSMTPAVRNKMAENKEGFLVLNNISNFAFLV